MRTNIYVDGFNLYYGALKGEPFRWLDLEMLSRRLLQPSDSIGQIRYFTARVSATDEDPEAAIRQQQYLRALGTLASVQVHFGLFLTSERTMPAADGSGLVRVLKTEEKGSDVNLATHLLLDACRGDFELALVISNDSDLAEPVRKVQEEFGLSVGVALPLVRANRHPSKLLIQAATFVRRMRNRPSSRRVLQESQFPATLTDSGGEFRKPEGW